MKKNKIEDKESLTVEEIARKISKKNEDCVTSNYINQALLKMGLIKKNGDEISTTEEGAKFCKKFETKSKKEVLLWKKELFEDIKNKYAEILADEYNKQEEEIQARIDRAVNLFGKKVTPNLDINKLEQVLNPNGQNLMMPLYEFYYKNDVLLVPLVFQHLSLSGYIKLYDDKNDGNGLIICNKPYTDFYIKPILEKGNEYILITKLLVISDEVAETLQEFIDEIE